MSDTASTPPNPSATTPIGSSAPETTEVVDRLRQTAHDAVDRVAAAAAPAVEKLRTSATSAKQTLQAKADEFGAMEEQWMANARNIVREHPLTAVAVGVLVGLLIGRAGGHGRRDD